jgi:hypothetical protein
MTTSSNTPAIEKQAGPGFGTRWLGGALTGCCEAVIMMPLEVVKTRQQLGAARHMGVVAAMTDTVRHNGIRGLYYGLPIVLIQTSGKVGIRFALYGQFLNSLAPFQLPTSLAAALAGFGAGAAEAALWITPCERIKTLRHTQVGVAAGSQQYVGWLATGALVRKKLGFFGLYRGMMATVLRNGGSVAFRHAVFGNLMERSEPLIESRVARSAICGATVGAASTVLNNPIDVLKSRMQADDGKRAKYKGVWDCCRTIVREEGAQALMDGLSARLIKISLGQVRVRCVILLIGWLIVCRPMLVLFAI